MAPSLPDPLRLQTSGELIQILGTPRHPRLWSEYRPVRSCKKKKKEISRRWRVGAAVSKERLLAGGKTDKRRNIDERRRLRMGAFTATP